VVQLIEQAIIDGRLIPGERITEVQLSGIFGVSRTPIREAIPILEARGLVVRRPNRATVVAPRTSWDEAHVLYQLRAPLESHLAGTAATSATSAEIRGLVRLQTEFRALLAEDLTSAERQQLVELDSEYHWLIFRAARSDLTAIIRSYWGRLLRELSDRCYRTQAAATFAEQHEAITDALRRRDALAARTLMARHVEASWSAVSSSYDAEGSTLDSPESERDARE
jgi:DNA-binding GntR family transcriptional regulator